MDQAKSPDANTPSATQLQQQAAPLTPPTTSAQAQVSPQRPQQQDPMASSLTSPQPSDTLIPIVPQQQQQQQTIVRVLPQHLPQGTSPSTLTVLPSQPQQQPQQQAYMVQMQPNGTQVLIPVQQVPQMQPPAGPSFVQFVPQPQHPQLQQMQPPQTIVHAAPAPSVQPVAVAPPPYFHHAHQAPPATHRSPGVATMAGSLMSASVTTDPGSHHLHSASAAGPAYSHYAPHRAGAGGGGSQRTEPCRHYLQGRCNRRKCRFPHLDGPRVVMLE